MKTIKKFEIMLGQIWQTERKETILIIGIHKTRKYEHEGKKGGGKPYYTALMRRYPGDGDSLIHCSIPELRFKNYELLGISKVDLTELLEVQNVY